MILVRSSGTVYSGYCILRGFLTYKLTTSLFTVAGPQMYFTSLPSLECRKNTTYIRIKQTKASFISEQKQRLHSAIRLRERFALPHKNGCKT